ncbi:uncharacterized protein LOC127909849 [Oncorhynchus keta]|uniref:uncharacterized protein LOC127909849 n=1 Tax=Oncorhynchus keta TaxID=8018 RepID=UPI00227D368A|nr:uncharacterized protein LOC127909849 [Oncorhynchus keta]
MLILNTGAPQECMLSPLLYSLFTHDCVARQDSTAIKFADDTTVVGLIIDNDETAYREEVRDCQDNNLSLNVSKTKEMIWDYRKRRAEQDPINIDRAVVEWVKCLKFLGVHIINKLSWSKHTKTVVKRALQSLFPLRRLKIFDMGPQILKKFYSCTIESNLTGCITAWCGNCSASDCNALQDLYSRRCQRKDKKISDSSHPSHGLFSLLPHGKRYQSAKSRSKMLLNSFYPQAIILLNNESNGLFTLTPRCYSLLLSIHSQFTPTYMYKLPRLTSTATHLLGTGTPCI